MRILMIGDVYGRPGRKALKENLPELIQEYQIDAVIANGENAAGGNGITSEIGREFFSWGVDVITMGNHVWNNRDIFAYLPREPRIIRPANYPDGSPGQGSRSFVARNGVKMAVLNISGQVFMQPLGCPFHKARELLAELDPDIKVIILDFHAEATSEKVAMGWFLDGQVSAVCGTHTHVQTADERILPQGTAYITDVGMTGPKDSVIGVEKELVIEKFVTQMPRRFEVALGDYQLNAVVIEIDPDSGQALSIERIQTFEA